MKFNAFQYLQYISIDVNAFQHISIHSNGIQCNSIDSNGAQYISKIAHGADINCSVIAEVCDSASAHSSI